MVAHQTSTFFMIFTQNPVYLSLQNFGVGNQSRVEAVKDISASLFAHHSLIPLPIPHNITTFHIHTH